jgi:hypothetical protein
MEESRRRPVSGYRCSTGVCTRWVPAGAADRCGSSPPRPGRGRPPARACRWRRPTCCSARPTPPAARAVRQRSARSRHTTASVKTRIRNRIHCVVRAVRRRHHTAAVPDEGSLPGSSSPRHAPAVASRRRVRYSRATSQPHVRGGLCMLRPRTRCEPAFARVLTRDHGVLHAQVDRVSPSALVDRWRARPVALCCETA